jgi:hypothetical protein
MSAAANMMPVFRRILGRLRGSGTGVDGAGRT